VTAVEQIIAYGEEMGLSHSLTVESLIASHKYLRAQAKDNWAAHREDCDRIREVVREQTRQQVQHGEYVAVEKLKAMTLQQIAALLE
jgi:hypothetical protein